MKIKVILLDISNDKKINKTLNVDIKNTTITQLTSLLLYHSFLTISFKNYYIDIIDEMIFEHHLPYIIKKNKIKLGCPYWETTLEDFFNTHNITDGNIIVECGYPPTGGPAIDYKVLWELFIQFLNFSSALFGSYEFAKAIYQFILKKYKCNRKINSPFNYIDFVYSRNHWNITCLQELVNLNKEETHHLLLLCGYNSNDNNEFHISKIKRKKRIKEFKKFNLYISKTYRK